MLTEGQRLRLSTLGLEELSALYPRDIEVTYLRTMSTIPWLIVVQHDNGAKQFSHGSLWEPIAEPTARQVQPEGLA